MSNILIDLTKSSNKCQGKLIIYEICSLCNIRQEDNKSCIRNNKTNRIICKSCIRSLSLINLKDIIKNPDQLSLKV